MVNRLDIRVSVMHAAFFKRFLPFHFAASLYRVLMRRRQIFFSNTEYIGSCLYTARAPPRPSSTCLIFRLSMCTYTSTIPECQWPSITPRAIILITLVLRTTMCSEDILDKLLRVTPGLKRLYYYRFYEGLFVLKNNL